MSTSPLRPAALLALTALLAACGSQQTAQAPAPAPATASAPASQPSRGGAVTDSSKVEAGQGRKVKGINNWEGEITGTPARGSRFGQLQIGMPMKQVTDLVGAPTDQGAYMTGKAWIPFYFGSDRHRYELVYKGQGRLIFAGEGGFGYGAGNLVWIIHNANEPGYR